MRFSTNNLPTVGRNLGYLGLIPFIALTVAAFIVPPVRKPAVFFGLFAYGVTIVSFLGAIHWGLTMVERYPDRRKLVWGVTPSLIGWLSFALPVEFGLLLLVGVLMLCLAIDFMIYPHYGLEHWLTMRAVLSVVASVCLTSSALYAMGVIQ